MLGDTAVAVSPKDLRYQALIGKMIVHPLTGREIPIIADAYVDPEFGTGAVKITPAHDPNDYEIGLRHSLPFINMMTPDGKINEEGKTFAGLTMLEGREAIVEKMKALGHFVKREAHSNRVGISYRSKAVIEPYLSKQWFIRMGPFKDKLKNVVTEGRTKLIPKSWDNTYFHWIDGLRDWCISRQLWWGHRIPIWYKKSDPETFICLDQESFDDPEWVQENDVLDTWFSSALWPFAALGWPEDEKMTEAFYPNATLITGHDILFFWVARMLMMGEYVMGQTPFPEVFLHGLIFGKSYWRENKDGGITYVTEAERKAFDLGAPIPKEVHYKWEKMSKSKGNVLDPLEIIDEYGADALRMTMCASATQAREIDLDRRKFEEFRNFSNKFWNGSRFVFMQVEDLTDDELKQGIDRALLTLED
jgi:valyl-tRNA synthetase